jgi:UDP-glucose 4-epimerase
MLIRVFSFRFVSLRDAQISAVIHFAGLKAVGESVQVPLRYFSANVAGTISLLEAMERNRCMRIVFSSSSCVYGDKNEAPFREDMPTMSCHPYGETKLTIELLLLDLTRGNTKNDWQISILRYFNPIGAHERFACAAGCCYIL